MSDPDEPIPILPGQTDALALLDPPLIGAAGQCTEQIITPGLEALGVYFHCWRPTPCPDHDQETQ